MIGHPAIALGARVGRREVVSPLLLLLLDQVALAPGVQAHLVVRFVDGVFVAHLALIVLPTLMVLIIVRNLLSRAAC